MTDAYTIGIEEEYFLVDAESKMVAEQRPEAFFAAAKAALGPQLMGEMLQSQLRSSQPARTRPRPGKRRSSRLPTATTR